MTLSKEDEKLWDLYIQSGNSMVQEFETMVVGVGALFFAYGEVYSLNIFHLRLVIALAGLFSSLIILTHFYNAFEDRVHVELLLSHTDLDKMYKKAVSWRQHGLNRYFYWRNTRLNMYFSALISIIWLEIVLIDFSYAFYNRNYFTFSNLLPYNVLICVGFIVVIIVQKAVDFRKLGRQQS